MSSCMFLTPSELQALITAGVPIEGGPYDTEAECLAVCITDTGTGTSTGTDEQAPRAYYCLENPIAPIYTCYFLSIPELNQRLSAGYTVISGPWPTEAICESMCEVDDTGTGTGTGSFDLSMYCLSEGVGQPYYCYAIYPDNLADLLAAGWQYHSGPYSLTDPGPAQCEADCATAPTTGTGSDDAVFYYCMYRNNEYYCFLLEFADIPVMIALDYQMVGGPYETYEECNTECSALTGTGTLEGSLYYCMRYDFDPEAGLEDAYNVCIYTTAYGAYVLTLVGYTILATYDTEVECIINCATFDTGTGTGSGTGTAACSPTGIVDSAMSEAYASPTTVDADGVSIATITFILRDVDGYPVCGLSCNCYDINGIAVVGGMDLITDDNGMVVFPSEPGSNGGSSSTPGIANFVTDSAPGLQTNDVEYVTP